MPLFQHTDADEILAEIDAHFRVLARALSVQVEHDSDSDDDDDSFSHSHRATSPLHRDLLRLIGVANGQFDRTDANVRRAELALQRVMRAVSAPLASTRAPLPNTFWDTTLGVLVARTRWWISSDELLTISNAAALAFGENTQPNRMRITRAIDRGELESFPDPSAANPQHNKRVLKAEVLRLGARRRPGAFK